jgi:2-dehydro-3-deoxygluconokinase
MSDRFVSIGECMVEMAPVGDGHYAMGFAGDTLNTAWYARRALPAGWSVDYVTAVGIDAVSDGMVAFFRDSGLSTAHVARVPNRTVGLYLIQLDGAERSFAYWRSTSAAKTLASDANRLAAALKGARVAYVSGITLAILPDTDRPMLFAALDAARAYGTTVVFDPNLRPRLWPSPDAMRATITEAARHADILLPSFDDEATHFGDANRAATALRYAALGSRLVVVKNADGEMIVHSNGELSAHPPVKAEKIVDTTAAGDSFNAGFLAAHLAGKPLAEAVQDGARLAAKVIGARGALVET